MFTEKNARRIIFVAIHRKIVKGNAAVAELFLATLTVPNLWRINVLDWTVRHLYVMDA